MPTPGFFKRLLYALAVLVRFVFDGRFAAPVLALWEGRPLEGPVVDVTPVRPAIPERVAEPVAPPPKADAASALHLLAILQRDGRFIDFLQEDVSSFEDADVGAAARLVHEGCRKALDAYLPVEPLRSEGEGASIVVDKGFDPTAIRLTGNVAGEPPFTGALRHHGWRASEVKLPTIPAGQDLLVIAPAEVEL